MKSLCPACRLRIADARTAELEWERDEARGESLVLAKEAAKLMSALDEAREKLAAAERRAQQYHDALVSRHGGEPLALLSELDEAREKLRRMVEASRGYLDRVRQPVGCGHCIVIVDRWGRSTHEPECILRPLAAALAAAQDSSPEKP